MINNVYPKSNKEAIRIVFTNINGTSILSIKEKKSKKLELNLHLIKSRTACNMVAIFALMPVGPSPN